MERTKAIEILSLDLTYTYPARYNDLQDAIKLGIEALKLINTMGVCPFCLVPFTLPSETPPDTLLHPSTPFIGNRP